MRSNYCNSWAYTAEQTGFAQILDQTPVEAIFAKKGNFCIPSIEIIVNGTPAELKVLEVRDQHQFSL